MSILKKKMEHEQSQLTLEIQSILIFLKHALVSLQMATIYFLVDITKKGDCQTFIG
ncbi:MAG: hypothetical protein ACI976_002799 [Aureispira sp.]|jgi:hypothetical protein